MESLRAGRHGILVLCHKRTWHLEQVIAALKSADNFDRWEVLFCAQDPTIEVLQILEGSNILNASIVTRELAVLDFSVKKSINSNLYWGLEELFINKNKEFVIVLEDDIVISKHFFTYMEYILHEKRSDKLFRGVNSLSTYFGSEGVDGIGRYSQGFMTGWGTTKQNYKNIRKFWTGNEDTHWDHFLEPYLRTGYVINPVLSLVKNIGFDETASHSKPNPEFESAIVRSFELGKSFSWRNLKEVKFDYRIREDFVSLSNRSWISCQLLYLSMKLSFMIYFAGIKVFTYCHFKSRVLRNAMIRKYGRDKTRIETVRVKN